MVLRKDVGMKKALFLLEQVLIGKFMHRDINKFNLSD